VHDSPLAPSAERKGGGGGERGTLRDLVRPANLNLIHSIPLLADSESKEKEKGKGGLNGRRVVLVCPTCPGTQRTSIAREKKKKARGGNRLAQPTPRAHPIPRLGPPGDGGERGKGRRKLSWEAPNAPFTRSPLLARITTRSGQGEEKGKEKVSDQKGNSLDPPRAPGEGKRTAGRNCLLPFISAQLQKKGERGRAPRRTAAGPLLVCESPAPRVRAKRKTLGVGPSITTFYSHSRRRERRRGGGSQGDRFVDSQPSLLLSRGEKRGGGRGEEGRRKKSSRHGASRPFYTLGGASQKKKKRPSKKRKPP